MLYAPETIKGLQNCGMQKLLTYEYAELLLVLAFLPDHVCSIKKVVFGRIVELAIIASRASMLFLPLTFAEMLWFSHRKAIPPQTLNDDSARGNGSVGAFRAHIAQSQTILVHRADMVRHLLCHPIFDLSHDSMHLA